MMHIGIIGLGDIAQKAYLPLIQNEPDISLHLFTPNKEKLQKVGERFRITNLHETMESLLRSGIKAAFVHAATIAHFEIIERLLENNIHVYVDKPITSDFSSAKQLTDLALNKRLILMTGFNRRFAPAYRSLAGLPDINMVVMQKNRRSLPGDIRTFVYDDFIHVVDTLRFIFRYPIKEMIVKGKVREGILYHVVLQMIAENGAMAIGIMNRDSGVVEERLEVFSPAEKRVAVNISESFTLTDRSEVKLGGSDWEPTLYKRGFKQIIEEFIKSASLNNQMEAAAIDSLITHEICESIVEKLSKGQ